ncbi:hypothetical protein ACSU64_23970 [Bacillaceae bacterium C204]|uniref:hypothetical protein n=1 Tax=Neobacillus sp. 204 TaxID=3383351 RepID=UPI00397BF4A5
MYRPIWYTGTDNDEVVASLANSDDFFMVGHWINRKADAKGKAVIVKEKDKDVTWIRSRLP